MDYKSIRLKAETIIGSNQTPKTTNLHAMSLEEIEKIVHELEVHQIELNMQNEELLETQLKLENAKKRYFDLYDLAPIGYCKLNEESQIEEANLAVSNLFGIHRNKLIKQSIFNFIFLDDKDIFYVFIKKLVNSDLKHTVELRMISNDKKIFWAQLTATYKQSNQELNLIIADITKQKSDEQELRIAAVTFDSQNGMVITDKKSKILKVNQAFCRLTGYSEKEAVGETMRLLKSDRQKPPFYKNMWDAIKTTGRWQGEIWNKRKNGEIYAELLTISAIKSDEGELTNYVGNFSDITEDKEVEAQIHRLAYYDPLTNLPNRRLLQDRLNQAITATARSEYFGAIFFIDLDEFKKLNDTRGHDVGDLLLVQLAQRFKKIVRLSDTVSRFGGDEFVLLLEDLSVDIKDAAIKAKQLSMKLFESIEKPFLLEGFEYFCKLSIGIGIFNKANTIKELFKHADIALYEAKHEGHNKVKFFDPEMQKTLELRNTLEIELMSALKNREFQLFFQPQLDNFHNVIGVEALLRWNHPKRGLVSPDDFIPIAEESSLIIAIGLWVLESACRQLKTWENDSHTNNLHIAVNVSARQFHQIDIVSQVKQTLESSGANPSLLKLELTESLLLDNVEDSVKKMQKIRELGVTLSIDDFGTGYSSLKYLARLPLNQLKIDKSFVFNIGKNKDNEMIIYTIISMGVGLKMDVIAEGVETKSQYEFLKAHGCNLYQGYLFSKPLPIDKLEVFLKSGS